MKNKLKLTLLVAILVSVWYYNSVRKDSQISSLALQNIEALADEELTMNTDCIGTGSVDCPGDKSKVEYVFSGYAL